MIFSFSDNSNDLVISARVNLDIFCFFKIDNSVNVPDELWFPALCASLRRKREVLVLESTVSSFPSWDSSKRWVVGDHWLWLAPRSLSSIQQFYSENSTTYDLMKSQLISSK